jgi:hypothetical protein
MHIRLPPIPTSAFEGIDGGKRDWPTAAADLDGTAGLGGGEGTTFEMATRFRFPSFVSGS